MAVVLRQAEPSDNSRAELLPDEIPALCVRHIPLPVCPHTRAPHQLSPQPARGTNPRHARLCSNMIKNKSVPHIKKTEKQHIKLNEGRK